MVVNPRFRKNRNSQEYADARDMHWRDYVENYYIEVPCGKCYLCRKKKANGWRVRLLEELKSTPTFRHDGITKYRCIFVLFTFDNAHLPKVSSRDELAPYIRKWRDLWRKKYGKSPRYFAVTDCGTQFGRLHLHLLIFDPCDKNGKQISISALEKNNFFWRNGFVRQPTWLKGQEGITYVTGYITGSNLEKEAIKHGHIMCKEAMEYKPIVFVSNGLGADYLNHPKSYDIERNQFVYHFNGFTYALPSYYRYKLYDEELRWHSNLIYKKEKEQYIADNMDSLIYSFNGSKMSYDVLERLYESTFKKFDSDNNKQLKLLHNARQQSRKVGPTSQTQLQGLLVEGLLQDQDNYELW